MKPFLSLAFISFLAATPAMADVAVSSPATGTTVSSPVHYTAFASSDSCSKGVASIGIYVDYRRVYVTPGARLNTSIALNPGTYHTVVEEWDRCGNASDTSVNLRVVAGQSGVSVRYPANNSTVASPVRYVASARASTCAKGVSAMGIYVNNRRVYVVPGASLNTSLPLNPGTYHTVVEEWDGCGGATITPVNLNVQSTGPGISSIQVACYPAVVAVNGTSSCHATVNGTGAYSSSVRWFASDGSITPAGFFTAPGSDARVEVTATSTQDSGKTGTATISVQSQTPATKHVVVVMEENQSYSSVVGNTASWPNLNNLIANGALPTHYFGNTHPSIGNYFELTTGQILTNNDNSTQVWNVDNIARRMLAAGVSFRIYAEGVPRGYVGGNTGAYLIRHEPFAMLSDIAGNQQVAYQHIWPFSQFAQDVANGTLPEFAYIVPDVNDDAHNGSPYQADNWLQSNVVARLYNSSAFAPGGDGLLIVDFDEAFDSDARYGGGQVSPVFWGPTVKPGYRQTSTTIYQHQSMLRTIMQALQLPNPPGAAATAPSMAEFFKQ